ncbi:CpsB/CapC family capsule biosynthesis tyrosine phosphatase [Olivibacter sp. CPCC 100613]|uniref:CpsB/CapC family capsule biosynthesis tyrosine phosphatase n=1 Tax=Olivibacter sp. CPCC 100613 TaxID=3079931 RepID=UPI002FF48C9A
MFSILPTQSAMYTGNGVGSILAADIHIDLLKPSFGYFNSKDVTEELKNAGYTCIFGAVSQDAVDAKAFNSALPIHAVRLYHLDADGFRLQKEKLETFGKNYILLEAPADILSRDLEDVVVYLNGKGLQPVLAKAEQYACLQDNYRNITRLHSQGCLLESDLLSLAGGNGVDSKRLAQKLFKEERVSFVGSGARSTDDQQMINDLFHSKKLVKQLQSPCIKNREII